MLAENPVTGFAFALFLLLVLAALSALARALRSAGQQHARRRCRPPSAAHWFGTDQLGRDIFSRVVVATRLDLAIAIASVALVFAIGAASPASRPAISAAGPTASSAASPTPSWPSRCSCWRWASSRRSATRVTNIVIATAIINFPLYARVARAEANVRREAGFVKAARLSGNGELRILLAHILPNIMPIMVVQMSLNHGLRDPQRRRPVLHRSRRAPADAGMGDHGGRRCGLHRLGRMVDRAASRASR